MPRLRSVVPWLGVALAWLVVAMPGAHAADVHGDDDADRYVGTGGLVLPGSVGVTTQAEVADCLGCQWRLSSPCLRSGDGNPFSGTPTCLSVVRGCPDRAQLLRAWFQPPGGSWREIGLVCIGDGGPVTVVGLGSQVHEWITRGLPPQRLTFQPTRGAVTQLPVVFDSGQSSAGLHATLDLAGRSVALEATPTWRWEFGDGTRRETTDPGGAFPNLAVAHSFRVSRAYRVRMVTTWTARFTVEGLGPFPVTEPVSQSTLATIPVGEGRAVLAPR